MAGIATPGQLRMSLLRWVLVCVPGILLLGMLSGVVANSGYDNPWFDALIKPAIMPPGWVFGAVWTVLYVLLGLALAIILNARAAQGKGTALALFGVQFLLNLGWSTVFFHQHRVMAAFWLVVGILVLAALTTAAFARIRPVAAVLMLPYLAWLAFASVLTWQVDALNPDVETLVPQRATTQIAL